MSFIEPGKFDLALFRRWCSEIAAGIVSQPVSAGPGIAPAPVDPHTGPRAFDVGAAAARASLHIHLLACVTSKCGHPGARRCRT